MFDLFMRLLRGVLIVGWCLRNYGIYLRDRPKFGGVLIIGAKFKESWGGGEEGKEG